MLGTIIWVSFWSVIILLCIIPHVFSTSLAGSLGFKSNINAVIFVALGFLFLIVYNQSATIEALEKQITALVRKTALEKQEIKDLHRQLDKKRANNNKTGNSKSKGSKNTKARTANTKTANTKSNTKSKSTSIT